MQSDLIYEVTYLSFLYYRIIYFMNESNTWISENITLKIEV